MALKMRLVRPTRASRSTSVAGFGRTAVTALIAGSAFLALIAHPALAAGSGSTTATINVGSQVRSLTVSPTAINFCTPSSPLVFPNGLCFGFPVTITFGNVAGHVDVSGADAVPADGGIPNWTLCGGTGPTCAVDGNVLGGTDQYSETTQGSSGMHLANSPQCDTAFNAGTCSASANQASSETFNMFGPFSSTNQSVSFQTNITWAAVP
jgi:hypothetical protein